MYFVVSLTIKLFLFSQEWLGNLDRSCLETSPIAGLESPEQIRKVYLFDHSEAHAATMTTEKWIEHGRIVSNIAKLIQDPVLYKLLILLTLTKMPIQSSHNDLAHLHATYLSILRRRQSWIENGIFQLGTLCSAPLSESEIISKVCESLNLIDQLTLLHSEMFQRLNCPF